MIRSLSSFFAILFSRSKSCGDCDYVYQTEIKKRTDTWRVSKIIDHL